MFILKGEQGRLILPKQLKIGKVRRSKHGVDFVAALGGRQHARVLRLATPCFPAPPFYRFSTASTIMLHIHP